MRRSSLRRLVLASAAVTLIAFGVSGCSKCANWVPWYGNGACQTTPSPG